MATAPTPFVGYLTGSSYPRDMTIVSTEPLPQDAVAESRGMRSWVHEGVNRAALNAACVVAETHGYMVALIPRNEIESAGRHAAAASVRFDPYEKGRSAVQQLKDAEGGAMSRTDAASRLRISLPALYSRIKKRQVIAWTESNGRLRFPHWQFGPYGMLDGVTSCLDALGPVDEWAVMRFFLAPNVAEGNKSALELLREGNVETAVNMAKRASIHA